MHKQILCILLVLITCVCKAQPSDVPQRVTVVITAAGNAPLEGATAELRRIKDSLLVKTALADNKGVAIFESVKPGVFFIKLSNVGFVTASTAAFSVDDAPVSLPAFAIQQVSTDQLQYVTVTARKPFIQNLADRIVVNVENSIISAGSSAIDVLERSPGVNIDQNDNITLRGRSGVIIFIDGRRSALTGADLGNYLRGLPSNAIDRIEIITNPSAKYDAAGNSGIIDIYMKKDQSLGANGTLTAGYGQGVYPKANAGTTFNYRKKR